MVFDLLSEMGKVAFLTKAHETLGEAFQLIPDAADVLRLFMGDAVV
jgi:hypothetical protein